MQLSKHITLKQMVFSQTADLQGFDNSPSPDIISNLKHLAVHIIEPVLAHFGGEIDITSGYRCKALNDYLGSRDTSQHCVGEAVDFGIIDTDVFEIASWINDNLQFDHLILEKYNPDDLNKGWVHCSLRAKGGNRRWVQTYDGCSYHEGLKKLPLRS